LRDAVQIHVLAQAGIFSMPGASFEEQFPSVSADCRLTEVADWRRNGTMRTLSKMALVVAASLVLAPAALVVAQPPEGEPGGTGGQSGRGGFGRMGQRVQGIVTAVAGGNVTIRTEAGDTYVLTPGDNAGVMKDRQPIQIADIKPGDMVAAMGQVDATKKTVTAMMLMDVDAATVAKAKENLGKTYITGRITAVDADNLKLTVERQDKVAQVIAVDEGTSFQRGMRGVAADIQAAGGMAGGFGGFGGGRGVGGARPGTGRQGGNQSGVQTAPESITLADIKVGDVVAATGSVKNGSFVAQKMGVMRAGTRGGGRMGAGPGEGGGAPPPPPPAAQ
jgi:hypothetical protein